MGASRDQTNIFGFHISFTTGAYAGANHHGLNPVEKRKSERVQFFQMGAGNDIRPVWVFRKTLPEAKLGLVVDIGADGVQILTDKSENLSGGDFQLIVYVDGTPDDNLLRVNARCLWSRQEGSLYNRNGLIFEEKISVQQVLAGRDAGTKWLRCELLSLDEKAST
jgi:hypothetical protein